MKRGGGGGGTGGVSAQSGFSHSPPSFLSSSLSVTPQTVTSRSTHTRSEPLAGRFRLRLASRFPRAPKVTYLLDLLSN